MASRVLPDFIEAYLAYIEDTEPSSIFQKWTGISLIAAALRKKVVLNLGRIRVYPNIYIVLVAEPGVARKTQAINFGIKILNRMPEGDIITSADSITVQALIQDMEAALDTAQMPDGSALSHCSINVIAKEFESFLGQKVENTKMLVFLTDLFDGQELPYRYRTKGSGSNKVVNPLINMLAATTPDSLASSLPSSAIGGGFTSRVLFIWADRLHKKVTAPKMTSELQELEDLLTKDLYLISRMIGEFKLSEEAYHLWDEYYQAFDPKDNNRLCKDTSFSGWYTRKHIYIIKVAILFSASRSDKMIVEWKDIQTAMRSIEEVEKEMGNAFKAVGKSVVSSETDMVIQIIRSFKWITDKRLLSMVWRDLDATKFNNVMDTIIKMDTSIGIKRVYLGPTGEKGDVWYTTEK